jgi:lipid-A-disaccharide synthase
MRVLLSAGEASSDRYGAQLVQALVRSEPGVAAFGMGGDAMRRAGCELVVDAREIAVVGLAEVVAHLPRIWRRYRRLLSAVDEQRPDVAVLIDSPDFNLRLARQLHRRGIPVLYYVSPQLWAWRPGRVEQVRRYVRKMLVIFPFEEEWYRARGVDATFVGHPLAKLGPPPITREDFARLHGLDAGKQWIALLPGSRRREVATLGPTLVEAAAQLGDEYEYVAPLASTLTEEELRRALTFQKVQRRSTGRPRNFHVTLRVARDAEATLAFARAAAVASGTATVEAAVLGTPFCMVYRVSRLSWLMGRPLVRVPHFAMPNLIAGRRVVPELVQHELSAERVAAELRQIIPDGAARSAMLAGLAEVRQKLSPFAAMESPPADLAAEIVLDTASHHGGTKSTEKFKMKN